MTVTVSAPATEATGQATRIVGASLRGDAIGIDTDKLVIAERSDVRHSNNRVAVHLLFQREIPFFDRGSFRVRLNAYGRINGALRAGDASGARRQRYSVGRDRQQRRQRSGEGDGAVVGVDRIELEGQVVNQVVINAEARADGSLPRAKRIPCNSNTWSK